MDLKSTQLKDTYGNLLTIGETAGSPTTGTLQNGDGEDISILTLGNSSTTNHQFILQDSTTSARLLLSSGDLYIDGDVDGVGNRDIIFRVDGGDESMRLESNGDISFQDTSNNEAFYWDASAGSLGIGTQTPASAIHVSSSGSTYIKTERTTAGSESVLTLGSEAFENAIYSRDGGTGGKDLEFIIGTTTAMKIKSSGNVGIGTDSPIQPLEVVGNLRIGDNSASTESYDLIFRNAGSNGATDQSKIVWRGTDTVNTRDTAYIGTTNIQTFGRGDLFFSTKGTTSDAQPTERMRIHSGGDISFRDGATNEAFYWDVSEARLGLGTTSPSKGLHLTFSNDNASIRFENTASAKVWDLTPANPNVSNSGFSLHNVTDNTVPFHVTNGGNVGIGTTSPTTLLELSEDQGTTITLRRNNSAAVANDLIGKINFFNNDSSTPGARVTATVGAYAQSTAGGTYLSFSTATNAGSNAERMRIDSSGLIDVKKQIDSATLPSTPSNHALTFYPPINTGRFGGGISWSEGTNTAASINAIDDGSGGALGLVFSTGNNTTISRAMTIDSSGKLLVGTETALSGFSGTAQRACFSATGDTMTVQIGTGTGAYTGIHVLRQNSNGKVLSFERNSTDVGSISVTTTATAYNTSSDYRLKENIVELDGALDKVLQLKPSKFNFKSDADSTVSGFIAHEVQEVVPEAVTGEKDGMVEYEVTPAVLDDEGNVLEEAVMGTKPVYQGIDQSKLVPILVGAIQELRAEIEQLKNQ